MESVVRLKEFYQGKKIFLTGHTGFKGSWLALWLHSMGAEVTGYALPPDYKGLFQFLKPGVFKKSILQDIREKAELHEAIDKAQPDLVFHLAAQPLVRKSYEAPAETFEVNVAGTANLLEGCIGLQKACSIVVITTDKVYENIEQDVLYKETDALGGYDPYSASKACTELVVSSFRRSFFSPEKYKSHGKAIASARAGNVIGGGDFSTDRIFPDIIKSLNNGTSIQVRNPQAIRPWQHVLEPLQGYLQLGALLYQYPDQYADAFNFGPTPQDHLTVKELVETAIEAWGSGGWEDKSSPNQPHEAGILKLDISKAVEKLNWRPKLSALEAIKWTAEWYKSIDEGYESALGQIEKYERL